MGAIKSEGAITAATARDHARSRYLLGLDEPRLFLDSPRGHRRHRLGRAGKLRSVDRKYSRGRHFGISFARSGAEDGRKSSAASDDNLGRIDWHVAGALGVERRCVAYYRSLLGRPARRISSLSFRQPSYSSVSLGGGRRRAVLVGPPHSSCSISNGGLSRNRGRLYLRCATAAGRSRASRRMLIRGPRRTPRDRMLKRPERGFLFGVPAKSSPGSCCWASPSSASPSA